MNTIQTLALFSILLASMLITMKGLSVTKGQAKNAIETICEDICN